MVKMERRKRILGLIVRAAIIAWVVMSGMSLIFFLIGVTGRWWFYIIGIIFSAFSGFYAYESKLPVPQEIRVLVEVMGAYWKTLGPGLHILPLWIAKARAQVNISTQRYALFVELIFIDFLDGSASPKGAMAFVRVMNKRENNHYQSNIRGRVEEEPQLLEYVDRDPAYRTKYCVKNIKEAVISLLENSTRSFLNSLTIQEAIQAGKAGYNILPALRNYGEIVATLANWGLILEKITVGDFNLSETIIQDREQVHKAMQADRAMKFLSKKREKEIHLFVKSFADATGKTMAEVKEAINNDSELKKNFAAFAQDMISRYVSIDAKVLTDIRVSGGSELGETIIQAITAWKRLS